ncbi:MAG: hypothetical protein K0U59_02125 [Gammaproteobacteria bacterium]|nr:hypothetical protein [Gammaproteobacteria bacterium]
MVNQQAKTKLFTLLRREVLEYRNSLVLAPAITGALLIVLMLCSVLLANRITAVNIDSLDILIDEHSDNNVSLAISADKNNSTTELLIKNESSKNPNIDEQEWSFGRDWKNTSKQSNQRTEKIDFNVGSLNPALNILHLIFLGILALTGSNYLANSFYQDRRDRTVLFWKSMPVSEREEIFAKLVTICLLAPAIYVAISIVTQITYILLATLLIWRIDGNATHLVLDNIHFSALFGGQIISWFLQALWLMPIFAWLLLCSTIARRSPMMLAFAVPLALYIIELVFFDSNWIGQTLGNYLQYLSININSAEDLETLTSIWPPIDFTDLFWGLALAALLLVATHWFRKHRFEPQ